MSQSAFIYDAVRTPRSKAKKGGSLYEFKPIDLASGLEVVNSAAQKVMSGWESLMVAGGVESMSRVPMGSDGGPWVSDPGFVADTGFELPQIVVDKAASGELFA